jgi:hypothetical protein
VHNRGVFKLVPVIRVNTLQQQPVQSREFFVTEFIELRLDNALDFATLVVEVLQLV